MSKIRLLSDDLVNQIAAGEIVERPAAVLKELIENSIDAKAQNIEIFLQNGGKSKLVVQDDGEGIEKDDLLMAIQRHATSKLTDNNLFDIRSYGFRGEALPSIASVSEFTIESKSFGITVDFSEQSGVFPSRIEKGTRVTVQNLFEKTPARLKFLKSDAVELTACLNVVENIALIRPDVNFSLRTDGKQIVSFSNDSLDARISKILGTEIFRKAIKFEEKSEHISVSGYLYHPIDNRYSQSFQRIFVNGRIVKDKIVSVAIRNAYKDLIPSGRFAIAVIFIEIDPFYIDANVSPTKSEVRFRDPLSVRKFLSDVFKRNIAKFDRISNEYDIMNIPEQDSNVQALFKHHVPRPSFQSRFSEIRMSNINDEQRISQSLPSTSEICDSQSSDSTPRTVGALALEPDPVEPPLIHCEEKKSTFFGNPVAQIFDSFIITETENGIMIIDQHAVHEKITQDKMIKNLTSNNKQFLVKPELLELTNSELEVAKSIIGKLTDCGFVAEIIQNSIMISAIPSVVNPQEAKNFMRDLLEDADIIESHEVLDIIRKKIADKACHNSIRFGRKLSLGEMEAIIAQMEEVPSIHQCNHHRPSFVEISKDQLEKMFNRS